jgi:hypothetical protein
MNNIQRTTIIAELSATIEVLKSGRASPEWQEKWRNRLDRLQDMLPSGSGIDNGTKIDFDRSSESKIVLTAGYHHMNDGGYYDGWTDHTITIRPTFRGIDITISGRNRNEIKDYLHDVYHTALTDVIVITYDQKADSFDIQLARCVDRSQPAAQ